jgi:hypothetical protein
MTLLLIVLCLLIVGVLLGVGGYAQYRRSRGKYERIAAALCDPGSWQMRFRIRTFLLKGRAGNHEVRYTVFGDGRKEEAVNSYLLLSCPTKGNFRFYAGSDPDLVDQQIRASLIRLQETPGFRGLLVTSAATPFLARLIARPLGFGYTPGLLLWRWTDGAFDSDRVVKDYQFLSALHEEGI